MAIYGKYITEAFFKSKLDKVEDLINKNKLRKASIVLSKVKPKEKDLARYNKLKEKIDQMNYQDQYDEILKIIKEALEWWDNPKDVWENSDYFQIMSVAGVSDQTFINNIKKKIKKYSSLKDFLKYMFGDDADENSEAKDIKSIIKDTDKLFIFNTNDDYAAFVNLSNNIIYHFSYDTFEKTSLKNVGGDYWDEKVIKDVLKKENIRFN